MKTSRALTNTEERAISLCQAFDHYISKKKLVMKIYCVPEVAQILVKLDNAGTAKILKSDWITGQNRYEVSYTLSEFKKYLDWLIPQSGIRPQVDGSFILKDDTLVTFEEAMSYE